MSKETTLKDSPQKHKGMKTSLYTTNQQQAYRQTTSTIYTKPQRIFVQTITQQPNVMPYIDSQYTNQPQFVSETQSEYVPMFERENNFVREVVNGENLIRVSPIRESRVVNNLSKTKIQNVEQNRFVNKEQNKFHSGGSIFVPPPPESFLINNTRLPQHRSPSMGKTVITVSPPPPIPATNFQIVKKTYIPQHIINQIPVQNNSESMYEQNAQHVNNNQSNWALMEFYDKLYQKYEIQKQQNQAIRQQLADAMTQISMLQTQRQAPQAVIHETIVQQKKPKVIDRQLLHDLLSYKWNRIVDEVVERRKQSCISQVSRMVETCKVILRIPGELIERQMQSGVYYA